MPDSPTNKWITSKFTTKQAGYVINIIHCVISRVVETARNQPTDTKQGDISITYGVKVITEYTTIIPIATIPALLFLE